MEPRIRYARTNDGVAIAHWSYGEGPALLHLPWLPWGHAQLEWQNPELNLWYTRLGACVRLIRYDGRGSGLSDHPATEYGVEAQLADIDAVVDQLHLAQFALLAPLNMGPAALHYASRHPERVSHLILWCTYAASVEYDSSPSVAAIRALLEIDWNLYTETGAHAFVGWSAGAAAHQIARLMRESTTAAIVREFHEDMRYVDCRSLLSQIAVPTLVIHPREFPLIDIAAARELASSIPDARFALFEGDSLSPTRGDLEGVLAAIADFVGAEFAEPEMAALTPPDPPSVPSSAGTLSDREIEVLRLVARGLSNRDIAEALSLSARTVERHVANIYAKVNVNNRAQAAAFAIGNGLL